MKNACLARRQFESNVPLNPIAELLHPRGYVPKRVSYGDNTRWLECKEFRQTPPSGCREPSSTVPMG